MNDFAAALAPKSDQINAQDLLAGDLTITIRSVKVTPGTEQPVSIAFEGNDKVWRPCKTTGRILMAAWGPDTSKYPGRSVQLYLDPEVKWGGLKVGGIRIRAISHIDAELKLALAESKQARKMVTVKPLAAPVVRLAAPVVRLADAPAPSAPDGTARAEARAAANLGTEHFRKWFKDNPSKRPEAQAIMAELKATCDRVDAAMDADPFGLPPIPEADPNPSTATDPELEAQIMREIAERDRALEG